MSQSQMLHVVAQYNLIQGINLVLSNPHRVEERLDSNKHKQKMLRCAEAFKNSDKEEPDKLSMKLELGESSSLCGKLSPSVSRNTSQSSSHRGWQILRQNTFSHLRGEVNHAVEEEVYHV